MPRKQRRRLSRFALTVVLGAAGCAPDPGGEGDGSQVESHDQALQAGYLAFGTLGVEIVEPHHWSESTTPFSVGALRASDHAAGAPFGSCGATFVSQHHAVTAAHCLGDHGPGAAIELDEIWLDQLDWDEFLDYLTTTGTWPNWSNGQLHTGYNVVTHECFVTRRCSSEFNFPREACPFPASQRDVDIAMVHCPTRPFPEHARTTSSLGSTTAARSPDDQTEPAPVYIWWFHEVYGLPTEPDGSEEWEHYGRRRSGYLRENYHYQRRHQLLPLLSRLNPAGSLYQTLDRNFATHNAIDAPACHGTSGSGVFLAGTDILLGPLVAPGTQAEASGRLCDRMNNVKSGEDRSRYIRGILTDRFVRGSPEVMAEL